MASSDPEEPRLACWKTFVPRQLGFCDRFCLEEDVLWGEKCPDPVMGKINGYAVSYETFCVGFCLFVRWFRGVFMVSWSIRGLARMSLSASMSQCHV